MIYLRLFFEFCRVGLFSVGGGLAISESTPGPMGVNMATYVGFTSGGVLGGVVSTLGLIFPSIVIILIIAQFLQRFRQSKVVDGVFYGLRAASVALITAAMLQVAKIALLRPAQGLESAFTVHPNWPPIALAVAVFVCVKFTPLKKIHPIFFILASAAVGVVFSF